MGRGVAREIKNLNVTLPDSLILEDFMNGHGFTVNRNAVM